MTSQDTEALKALVELAKKATPGPWRRGSVDEYGCAYIGTACDNPDAKGYNFEARVAECDFIVAAHAAIPALERLLASQGKSEAAPVTADVEPAPPVQEAAREEIIRSDTLVKAQYVAIKLHGGSGYTVPRNHVWLGDSILSELDGMEEGDKITLTFRPVNISDDQYEQLGDFEGH